MNTGVKLEPIAGLLQKQFFIRSYQRGYRWDEDQVNDLLNDFNGFIEQENKHEDEFYCLQPIVVRKMPLSEKMKTDFSGEPVYEVIDGQQISPLLLLYCITYSTHYPVRSDSDCLPLLMR
jgi:uncharacterized protein with ParB-like and HNH nuclease domain